MRLLIADDEKLVLEGLRNLDWASVGITDLICAANGSEALKMLSEWKPDILITDVVMPGFSGLEIAKIISRQKLNTKVIILSGYDTFSFAQEAIRYDVSEYLLKPCSAEEIMKSVERVLKDITLSDASSSLENLYLSKMQLASSESDTIRDVLHYIESNYMADITLSSLGEQLNYSPAYLSKLIKEKTDFSFLKLLTLVRMIKAAELLTTSDLKIYSICEKIGIVDPRYFSQVFRKTFGISPLEYKKSYQNRNINVLEHIAELK